MKIATFNVNGITSRLPRLLEWLDKEAPDVACLQELKANDKGLAGDFNVVPTDFDIYNPKSWIKDALLQPGSRKAFQRLLDQGWTDAIRAIHPKEAIFTFWDYFRDHWSRNAGLRIDHLLLSEELVPRLVDANVDRWVRGQPKASDHAPTWIELSEGETTAAPKRKAAKQAKRAAVTKAAKKRARRPA